MSHFTRNGDPDCVGSIQYSPLALPLSFPWYLILAQECPGRSLDEPSDPKSIQSMQIRRIVKWSFRPWGIKLRDKGGSSKHFGGDARRIMQMHAHALLPIGCNLTCEDSNENSQDQSINPFPFNMIFRVIYGFIDMIYNNYKLLINNKSTYQSMFGSAHPSIYHRNHTYNHCCIQQPYMYHHSYKETTNKQAKPDKPLMNHQSMRSILINQLIIRWFSNYSVDVAKTGGELTPKYKIWLRIDLGLRKENDISLRKWWYFFWEHGDISLRYFLLRCFSCFLNVL